MGHHRATGLGSSNQSAWTEQNESLDSRMRSLFKLALSAVIAVCAMQMLRAQDLASRAYIITPLHSNAVTLTWSFYDGGVNFNGTVPITGATGINFLLSCLHCRFNRRLWRGKDSLEKRRASVTASRLGWHRC